MIRLLLVDDQKNVRRGLRMRLELEPDVEVIGEADNGETAIDQVNVLHPDVILMDIAMPRMDGISATQALHDVDPGCCVVILSLYDDTFTRERAQRAGARAFVAKHQLEQTLMKAIRSVVGGKDCPGGSMGICCEGR
jgi:DNA-binding NarL/FixJ family response regulator